MELISKMGFFKKKIKLGLDYSDEEFAVLHEYKGGILLKIKRPPDFDCEIPRKMFVYQNLFYIGEIDTENGRVWALLFRKDGKYCWIKHNKDLRALVESL